MQYHKMFKHEEKDLFKACGITYDIFMGVMENFVMNYLNNPDKKTLTTATESLLKQLETAKTEEEKYNIRGTILYCLTVGLDEVGNKHNKMDKELSDLVKGAGSMRKLMEKMVPENAREGLKKELKERLSPENYEKAVKELGL